MQLETETDLRDIIGTLQTIRCMAATAEPTSDLLGQIAQVDSIINAARPLLGELPEGNEAQQIALVRSVRALRNLLL